MKSISNIAIQRTTFQKKNMKVGISSNPLSLEKVLPMTITKIGNIRPKYTVNFQICSQIAPKESLLSKN